MGRLGVLAGHSVLGRGFGPLAGTAVDRVVEVDGSAVMVHESPTVVLCQRHGDPYRAPHRIDHHAHAAALAELGCDRVLGIGSVGSLVPGLAPGAVLVPDDFIALHDPPVSRHDDERGHRVHRFDPVWRARVLAVWTEHVRVAGWDAPRDGGVYWQAPGPRFETPAEIRFMAGFADVVGMTLAGEAVAMGECDLPYAAVCIVDNYANGVDSVVLTVEEFEAGKRANHERLVTTLAGVVEDLAA